MRREEFDRIIVPALHETAVPRKNGYVGDAVVRAGNVLARGEASVENVELRFISIVKRSIAYSILMGA